MFLRLIFEDRLEGFSLEIRGKNLFDITQVHKLDEEITSLKNSFERVFKNVNFSNFHFTVAESDSPNPKIQIYAQSKNDWIEGLGVLSRAELIKHFEKINELQELEEPTKKSKNEDLIPKPPSNAESNNNGAKLSEEDELINPAPDDSVILSDDKVEGEKVQNPLNQNLPDTETPSENESVEDDFETEDQPSKPTNPQIDLADTDDSQGNSLKSEFNNCDLKLWVKEFSDEAKFKRFGGVTSDGRQFKFYVQNDDQLNLIKVSAVWNIPVKVTYNPTADKSKTFKDYLDIEFEEEIEMLSLNMSKIAKMPNKDHKLELLDEISKYITSRIKIFSA
ncbi:hypothetical protein J3998_01065 [Thiomicrorhabdus sp. 6S2-11]|uniref:Uncharacterized protein n=1 Tax=Thiomicrorhabdus marina TaxID=2818442 RepID=A0ABS3Q225_9GAMM|nr:hypothetical protein [Thiomicrorhabdus marina]MBO1926153.1 hypothetical protein [Thiomicrorhabdus marina]